jgi:hypothetical protein
MWPREHMSVIAMVVHLSAKYDVVVHCDMIDNSGPRGGLEQHFSSFGILDKDGERFLADEAPDALNEYLKTYQN